MGEANVERDLVLITYEHLPPDIPKENFKSNDSIKADYFFHTCLEEHEHNLTQKARLLIDRNRKKLIGFVTLHLARFKLKPPENESVYCPFLWVSNFAIDNSCTDQGYENVLLEYVHEVARTIGAFAGCRFILIEIQKDLDMKCLDPKFKAFLEAYGFSQFPYEIKEKGQNIIRLFQKQIYLEKLIYDLREDGLWI